MDELSKVETRPRRPPALTGKTAKLPELAEACAGSRRYAMNLLNKRHFNW